MARLVKVTKRHQVTLPKEVRRLLQTNVGDALVWELRDHESVTLRKLHHPDGQYLQSLTATLSEWNSVEDDKAYRSL